jgi:ankyrin repeat protein
MSKDTLDHNSRYGGWTALHTAAQQGHVDAVRQLLAQGADPNAREEGDHTYPLHWAVAHGHLETVRALLDAGTDVHGTGDDHELDVIGWATVFRTPGEDAREIASLLVERGARHHIFSAIALGDLDLIRALVERDPKALDRRMSHFEDRRTPLHFAMLRKRYDIVDLLIQLGADLEATDQNGRTALAAAILAGDLESMRRLHAAGAKQPSGWDINWSGQKPAAAEGFTQKLTAGADSIKKGVPMINVEDVGASLAWYVSIGFTEIGRFESDGVVQFGMVSFGQAEVMLVPWGKSGQHDVSLWFYTDDVERLYQMFKAWHIDALQAALGGEAIERRTIDFVRDIYSPPYGGREFGIRDPNGYVLNFLQTENR